MKKVLLISGSPRTGNTVYILEEVKKRLEAETELIKLKDLQVEHCVGCMKCKDESGDCFKEDDMNEVNRKLEKADLLIVGLPNYYDSAPGLARDFFDRTHPLYTTKTLQGKPVVFVYVGGGDKNGTQSSMNESVSGIIKYLNLDHLFSFSFQGLDPVDVKNEKFSNISFDSIAKYVNDVV